MLFRLEWRLKRHIQDPVLLLTAPPDEVDCLARLQDLVRQIIGQKGWDHDVVQLVLLRPEFIVTNIWISLNEELLERVIDFTGHHPSFNHGEDRRGNFFQNAADKLLS